VCVYKSVGVCVQGCGCVDIRYVQRVFEPSKYKNTIKIHQEVPPAEHTDAALKIK